MRQCTFRTISVFFSSRYGQVLSTHIRDPTWNINEYILSLYSKLKTWRKVYWHLWGDCHFLFCSICELPFPAHKIKWCSYHPEDAQYFTIDTQKAPLPVGKSICMILFCYSIFFVLFQEGTLVAVKELTGSSCCRKILGANSGNISPKKCKLRTPRFITF